jgi:polo-like kinase 1
MSSQAATAR